MILYHCIVIGDEQTTKMRARYSLLATLLVQQFILHSSTDHDRVAGKVVTVKS